MCFVENFLGHVTAKNYENWLTNKKSYCKNKKGIVFFLKHSVVDYA